jgi:HD-GYP domain-containing protein (c-di-GMP phosphodiesterase class II)
MVIAAMIGRNPTQRASPDGFDAFGADGHFTDGGEAATATDGRTYPTPDATSHPMPRPGNPAATVGRTHRQKPSNGAILPVGFAPGHCRVNAVGGTAEAATISEPSQAPDLNADPPSHQWQRRPVLSRLVRFSVVAAPAAAGIATAAILSRLLPRPSGTPQALVSFAAITVAMLLVIVAVERAARRLLPLAALLNLSLLFPDNAPRRFAVARRVGRPRDLQRQLQEARDRGIEGGEVAYMQTVLELVAALSVHDRQTRGHSERVRVFADLIAIEMKLSPADRARLRWASLLHDIGKLLVPSEILSKPAALTERERLNVQRHPEEGAKLIGPLRSWLGEWAAAVEHHHERWDGKGYPRALAAERISLAGRIVAVADSYEVMTAVRPYRRPIGVIAARQELVRCSGAQFDPTVVRAFLNISVGRLWRVVGAGSWIAQLPLLTWVNGLGFQWGSAIVSGSTALGLVAPGILPTPDAVPQPRSAPPIARNDASTHLAPTVGGPGPGAPVKPTGGGVPGGTPTPHRGGGGLTAGPSSGPTPSPTAAPTPTPTGQPGPTPAPTSGPTPTPAPTPPPSPTPTPSPVTVPTVTLTGPTSVTESTYTGNGSFSDPGGSGWSARVDYGDGTGVQVLTLYANNTFGLQHTYSDASTYSISVTVTNARLGVGHAGETLTVTSVAPVITMPAPQTFLLSLLGLGGNYRATGSFTDADPGSDGFTATVDYGDGSGMHPLTLSGSSFTLAHTYALGVLATFTVTVTITDDDGAVSSNTTTVSVIL